jgi:hypothetical protein
LQELSEAPLVAMLHPVAHRVPLENFHWLVLLSAVIVALGPTELPPGAMLLPVAACVSLVNSRLPRVLFPLQHVRIVKQEVTGQPLGVGLLLIAHLVILEHTHLQAG